MNEIVLIFQQINYHHSGNYQKMFYIKIMKNDSCFIYIHAIVHQWCIILSAYSTQAFMKRRRNVSLRTPSRVCRAKSKSYI